MGIIGYTVGKVQALSENDCGELDMKWHVHKEANQKRLIRMRLTSDEIDRKVDSKDEVMRIEMSDA